MGSSFVCVCVCDLLMVCVCVCVSLCSFCFFCLLFWLDYFYMPVCFLKREREGMEFGGWVDG